MNYNSTNTVQTFIRTVGWLFTMLVTSLFNTVIISSVSLVVGEAASVLWVPFLIFDLWLAGLVSKMFYILPEWDRIIVLKLGEFNDVRGPGFFVIPPFIYSVAATVDTRIETYQVEATATLTKDNVPTKVTAALEFRVEDPRKAIIDVQNFRQTVIWASTEALKNTIGSLELKELLSDRVKIAEDLKLQIDEDAAVYGVDVRAVRITDIDTPPSLVEELAVIARERRASEAKQIQANAEVLVATKIAEAATIMGKNPEGIRLRELQTLSEMSKNEGTMVIVYPYGDRNGAEIANGTSSQMLNQVYREDPAKKKI